MSEPSEKWFQKTLSGDAEDSVEAALWCERSWFTMNPDSVMMRPSGSVMAGAWCQLVEEFVKLRTQRMIAVGATHTLPIGTASASDFGPLPSFVRA